MSSTPPSSEDEKNFSKLEGGAPIGQTVTYGHDSLVGDGEGAKTQPDDRRTKAIMRKIDWRLLPICSILYLFSFLDRTAIGNARVAGMNRALGLSDTQYALALSLFFITYGAFEIPSNLMMKHYGAKIWLPIIVFLWGVTMMCTGFVTNFAGLLAMRLVLGLFEAGLFPGVTALLSFIYPRRYIQLRIGIFFSAATIAGAFGGLLAYGLANVEAGGYDGWSWIFIVEGILTIAVAFLGYFMLISDIDGANFLSEEDKDYMRDRVRFDGQAVAMNDEYHRKFVIQGLKDWKTWGSLVSYIGSLAPLYSIALTLPTILRSSLQYDAVQAQLMTVPVYTVAAVCVLIFAYLSDRMQNRTFFLCLGTAISAVGWAIGYASDNPRTRYAGCFIAAAGSYAGFPSVVALVSQNVGGKTKKATCIAIQVGVGGLAGMISSNIFPVADAPHFDTAYRINIALNCVAFGSALLNFFFLYMANKRKQAKLDSGEAARMTREEIADMGDRSPFFRYRY